MAGWECVRWSRASQIFPQLGWPESLASDFDPTPEAFFAELRSSGKRREAVFFLGQALPRFEAVVWAMRSVRKIVDRPASREQAALDATLAWVRDPSDMPRRAAFDAAGRADRKSPERFVALAAYFSGGSLAPSHAPPIQTNPATAGRLGALAVVLAAKESGRWTNGLDLALVEGEHIAAKGAEPLL